MRQPDGEHPAIRRPADGVRQGHEQKQQRETGDHVRHNQRGGDHKGEAVRTAKTPETHHHQRGDRAQHRRHGRRQRRNGQAQPHRAHHRIIVEQLAVPARRPACPDRHQLRAVKRVDHQHQHRRIQEGKADDQDRNSPRGAHYR